jgi:hypothetical protein
MGPLDLEILRQEEAATRQQAQDLTQLQQVDPIIVKQNTPESAKPKGKAKLGQRILNLGKQALQLILPKLISLTKELGLTEFENQRVQATTPDGIANLKARFCPTPQRLQELITLRNNIVGQLNTLGNKLNTLNFSIDGLQNITSTLRSLLTTIEIAKVGASAAAKFIPVVPGAVPALLNDLETIEDKFLPIIDQNLASLSATSAPIAIIVSIINKIVISLQSLDNLINLCLEDITTDNPILNTIEDLTPISDNIISISTRASETSLALDGTSLALDPGQYKGFTFRIEKIDFNGLTRRRALALNQEGVTLLQTELSFTANAKTLIDELKFIIDRDNLKSF